MVPPPASSSEPFDVPAVRIDLKAGTLSPLRDLENGIAPHQQPFVAGTVIGRVLRVANAGDCLNLREQPSTSAKSLGWYRDGVLFGHRGQQQFADGISWIGVSTPTGLQGCASAEYLDTGTSASGASAHPKGTRTGNTAIDLSLAAL